MRRRLGLVATAAALALSVAAACASSPAETVANGQRPVGVTDYPAEAIRLHQEGDVRLAMCVGADGRTHDVKVVGSSGSAALDKASIEQMSHIRFTPGTKDGKPVDTCDPPYELTVSWRLPK